MRKALYFLMVILAMTTVSKADADGSSLPDIEQIILTVQLEELIFSSGDISINYEGTLLPVHSIVKQGEQWRVKAGWLSCPDGHLRACPYCGGCAVPICPFSCDGYCCGVVNR